MTPDEIEALRRAYDDYIDVIDRGSPYPECIQKSILWKGAAFKYMPALLTLASRAVPAAADVGEGADVIAGLVTANDEAAAVKIAVIALAYRLRDQAKREAYAECLKAAREADYGTYAANAIEALAEKKP